MNLTQLLQAVRNGTPTIINESWAQGRTAYGGITGAVLCEACRKDVDSTRRLRNFEVGFLRPVEANKAFEIEVETLASGKTATMKSARLIQEGKLRATAKADFVAPLQSEIEINTFKPPAMKSKADSMSMALDFLPPFMQHFDNYLTTEAPPFAGKPIAEMGGWIRLADDIDGLTDSHLVCLIDSWPPTASVHYSGFKPLSTISWGIHFAEPVDRINPKDHLGYLAKVNFGKNGLSSSEAEIWSPKGQLLARSYQTNIIYG
ncbi:MAG: thioesterase family protein [Candidatus Pelagadaptatus aseana]|uniref:thioesterase family protein n=1 Tax=Candidatus Pelagadaptatus aseana TaxID=3120508 RepID=UPI0039B22825